MLLIGVGALRFLVAPELLAAQRQFRLTLSWLAIFCWALLVLAAGLELYLTLQSVLARPPSPDLLWRYANSSRHGHALFFRLCCGVLLALSTLAALRTTAKRVAPQRASWAALSLLLLASFSFISHATAMNGALAFAVDIIHYAAASLWVGPLLLLAFALNWRSAAHDALVKAFGRVSHYGLFCVLLLALTGSLSTLFHLQDPVSFGSSSYGFALWRKLILVALTVLIAALNRQLFLPRLRQGLWGLEHLVRGEAVILCLIILATAKLTTSPLPHAEGQGGLWQNLMSLWHFLIR